MSLFTYKNMKQNKEEKLSRKEAMLIKKFIFVCDKHNLYCTEEELFEALRKRQEHLIDEELSRPPESKLCDLIGKNSSLSIREIEKKIKWSKRKVRTTILRLERMGIVETEKLASGNRVKKVHRLVGWKKLVKTNLLQS